MQIQHLFAHFLFLSLFQHRIGGLCVVGSFLPLFYALFMLELLSTPLKLSVTVSHRIPPWGTLKNTHVQPTEHIQHKPTRHLPGVTPQPGCPGMPISGASLPLAIPACPRLDGNLSTLPGRRELAAQDCSRKTAHCQEFPDKWPNLSCPSPQEKSPGGKVWSSLHIFLWLGIWCQLLQLFDAVAQIFCFVNPEPGHLSLVEQVSRIYSIET